MVIPLSELTIARSGPSSRALRKSFATAVLVFISETYTRFNEVIGVINNADSNISGGQASDVFGCFLNLMHVSGLASGFNSAFSFGISVLIFFFLRGAYSIAVKSASAISNEVAKMWTVL